MSWIDENLDFVLPVFIWHIYHPRSSSSTSFICKYHDRWSLCVKLILWFCVIKLWWIDNIVCVSTRTQATCNGTQRINLILFKHELCISTFE